MSRWLLIPGAAAVYLLASSLAALALATVARRLVPAYYVSPSQAMHVPRVFLFLLVTTQALVLLQVLLLSGLFRRPVAAGLGFGRGRLPVREWPWLVLGGLAALQLGTLAARGLVAAHLLPPIGLERAQLATVLLIAPPATQALLILCMSVLVGLGEETLARGFLQRGLLAGWPAWAAMTASSVLFALGHGDLTYDVIVLPIACYLGFVAWRADSIWPAIAVHASVNAAYQSVLAIWGLPVLAAHHAGTPASRPGALALDMLVLVVSLGLLVYVLWRVLRFGPPGPVVTTAAPAATGDAP